MSLVPTDALVRPVEGHDDLFAFRFDFIPEGKALDAPVVTETDEGDLIIEGYAAVFDGLDREGENFTDGAFQRGIKSFLDGQASLNFHHKHDHGIGKVLDLQEEQGKGLKMKARVDFQPESSPLRYIYNAVKKGTYNALSVGGFFKRALVNGVQKIADVDFTEISVTPVPVHPGTNFAVVAGKALQDAAPAEEHADDDVVPGLDDIVASLNSLTERFAEIGKKALPDKHDPAAADHVKTLLDHVGRARQAATHATQSDHSSVKSHANALETMLAEHESKLHKLAAKVGPLPHYNAY